MQCTIVVEKRFLVNFRNLPIFKFENLDEKRGKLVST